MHDTAATAPATYENSHVGRFLDGAFIGITYWKSPGRIIPSAVLVILAAAILKPDLAVSSVALRDVYHAIIYSCIASLAIFSGSVVRESYYTRRVSGAIGATLAIVAFGSVLGKAISLI